MNKKAGTFCQPHSDYLELSRLSRTRKVLDFLRMSAKFDKSFAICVIFNMYSHLSAGCNFQNFVWRAFYYSFTVTRIPPLFHLWSVVVNIDVGFKFTTNLLLILETTFYLLTILLQWSLHTTNFSRAGTNVKQSFPSKKHADFDHDFRSNLFQRSRILKGSIFVKLRFNTAVGPGIR